MSVNESPSFRLSTPGTLQKLIKHTPVDMSRLSQYNADVVMKDTTVVENNNRSTEYTKHTRFQREMYVHYVFEKNLNNDAAANLVNVNTHTALKWKAEYIAGVPPPKKKERKTTGFLTKRST